jgi:hypothetical protein
MKDTSPIDVQQLISQGYSELIIVQSNHSNCPYLLKNQEGVLLEVENLETKISGIQANQKVWVKYTMLRKVSICNAQPISIDEVYEKK